MSGISSVWLDYIKMVFIAQIEAFRYWVTQKFQPPMQDDILKGDAEDSAQDYFKDYGGPYRDLIDASGLAEKAEGKAQDYYIQMTELRQGLFNLFAVGLYHMFEQQLFKLYRKDLLPPDVERIMQELVKRQRTNKDDRPLFNELVSIRMIKGMFVEKGVDVSKFKDCNLISELRLVANSIKHADGESCERLKRLRPELFINPSLRDFSPLLANQQINFPVFQPLSGESIFVSYEQLMKYINSILEFWRYVLNFNNAINGK